MSADRDLAEALATIREITGAVEVWPDGIEDYAAADQAMREALVVVTHSMWFHGPNEPLLASAARWLAYSGAIVTTTCDLCSRKWDRERLPWDHHDDERRQSEVCDRCAATLREGIRRAKQGETPVPGDDPKTDLRNRVLGHAASEHARAVANHVEAQQSGLEHARADLAERARQELRLLGLMPRREGGAA